MRMNSTRNLNAIMAVFLMVVAVLACSLGDETDKANKLVDEGNAAVQEANKYVTEAEEKKQKMYNAVPSIKTDAQLEQARALAKEAIAAYDKAKEKCDAVAKKYEEASNLKIKDKFKEYLTLKAKEWKKRAETVETAKGTPQALIDSENGGIYTTKANANNEKVDKLSKEANDFASQAEKLQKENKDVFKS